MSVLKISEVSYELERLQKEIKTYQKLIDKAKKKELSTENTKLSKSICLSTLPSPENATQLSSKEDLNSRCRRCADLLLRYGSEVL